jgi:hypothetical protein
MAFWQIWNFGGRAREGKCANVVQFVAVSPNFQTGQLGDMVLSILRAAGALDADCGFLFVLLVGCCHVPLYGWEVDGPLGIAAIAGSGLFVASGLLGVSPNWPVWKLGETATNCTTLAHFPSRALPPKFQICQKAMEARRNSGGRLENVPATF